MSPPKIYSKWPSAPLTDYLVRRAVAKIYSEPCYVSIPTADDDQGLLQWSSYDELDLQLTHSNAVNVLSSSYIIRKILIRKHFLSSGIKRHLKKNPASVLHLAVPRTYEFDISFADELDELFADELYDLACELDEKHSWWILKPGMADRGNGIRLFNSRQSLVDIFQAFEDPDSEEDEASSTSVVTSQLRDFVVQEYIMDPLLIDPHFVSKPPGGPPTLRGHKFHLRVYCVAVGALSVFMYDRILALFASTAYTTPHMESDLHIDLTPHLTNTCLQKEPTDENVRILEELVGSRILSVAGEDPSHVLSDDDTSEIQQQIQAALADTFSCAAENPVHFQAMPNVFELFGVDFLVQYEPCSHHFQVKLLELNAEPAIEMTGARLTWLLEDLFEGIARACVEPFFSCKEEGCDEKPWNVGESRYHLVKCMDMDLKK